MVRRAEPRDAVGHPSRRQGRRPATLREGALAALYLLTFEWARRLGYRCFDAGNTEPFKHDGVARFKAKLGLTPVANPTAMTTALYIKSGCSMIRRRLHERGIFNLVNDEIRAFPPNVAPEPSVERANEDRAP